MSEPTVAEIKQQFLHQQKQILSRGVPQSSRLYKVAERAGIQRDIVGDVMHKVNQNLKRHSKLVYSNQMTDHVVEQIDQLYWDAATTTRDLDSIHNGGNEDQTTLYQGDDLTLENNISKLPSTWDTSTDTPASDPQDPIDQDAYLSANAHLQDLSARRQVLRQKLSTYRALQELLAPYRDPRENVQPNLVHRDGPLETEMATTRTLAIRVAGRIGERYGDVLVPATADDGDGDADMGEEDGRAKLENVLSTW